jgi:hypothetical protein
MEEPKVYNTIDGLTTYYDGRFREKYRIGKSRMTIKAREQRERDRTRHMELVEKELQTILASIDAAIECNGYQITIKIPNPETLKILRKNYRVRKTYTYSDKCAMNQCGTRCKKGQRNRTHTGYTVAWYEPSGRF